VPVLTDADCMLRAVIARPEDDAPRLAFADWCDEHGDETWGEFIRVQCELDRRWPDRFEAKCSECGSKGHPTRQCFSWCESDLKRLSTREDVLNGDMGFRFYDQLAPFGNKGVGIRPNVVGDFALVRRGFVAHISLPAADFVRHAGELFGRWPIERVTLTDRAPGQFGNTKRWFFSAWSEDTTFPLHTLPFAILTAADGRLVRGGHVRGQPLDPWEVKDWETDVEANAAVSDACVRYGRELAGLPGGRPEGQVKQTSVMLPNLA
jgi:uncharacterized protein (TIGR02996 family)